MPLSQFVRTHKDEVLRLWCRKVTDRLGLTSDKPQLINHLPVFLDEVIVHLELAPEQWSQGEGALAHGRHRVETGVDIGGLAEEFGLIEETIFDLASEHAFPIVAAEAAVLSRLIARGAADSVRSYAQLRDRQFAQEASRHFSFIAHELRTPLQTAQLAGHFLHETCGEASPHLVRLDRALAQLAQLVDNSLVEARLLEAPPLHLEPQQALELLHQAKEYAAIAAARKNVRIELEGDELELDLDRRLMLSALGNLVVNAIKFSRSGATIKLRARHADDRALFEVEDECGGIPETVLPRLFQPFSQGTADGQGFGLGLMIVKQAVEAHGGTVRIANRPPHGCTFVIELPRTRRDS